MTTITIEPWQLFVGVALVLAGYLIGWVHIMWLTLRHEKHCQQVRSTMRLNAAGQPPKKP